MISWAWPASMDAALDSLLVALFLALPVAGLVAGPIYAPAVFGVAVLRLGWLTAYHRTRLSLDRKLVLLAIFFVAWGFAGLAWSAAPGRTAAGALQITFVLPAALSFVATSRTFPAARAPKCARAMLGAFLLGALILLADRIDGFFLLKLIDGKSVWPTKYNRGIDYFLLILFPTLGFFAARRQWREVGLLAVAAVLAAAAGFNTTAKIGLPLAAAAAACGVFAPRITGRALAIATAATALGLPLALRLVAHFRPLIAPHIKPSGLERLEIWDYLSAHVWQKPLFGWGLWTSRLLPATPAEMAHYQKAAGIGIYPHNQFLELWVETGFLGVVLGLAFTLLILHRAAKLPPALRAAAYATYVMAICVASLGFEITTDSWWAALAASAVLFALFNRALTERVRIWPEPTIAAPPPPPGTTHLQAGAPAPRRNRQVWTPRAPGGR